MLAMIAALQLVVLSQVAPPPKEVTPDEPGTAQAAPPASGENPPLPGKSTRTDAPPPAAPATPATPATTSGAPSRPRQLSLLSAEPLAGGSAAMAWAGWRSFGVAYAQGITN